MNPGQSEFWDLFQEISDRRQDPFDDLRIVDFLEEHPQLLAEAATIRQTQLDLQSKAARRARRPLLLAAATLILFALGATVLSLMGDPDRAAKTREEPLAGESRILEFRIRVETGTPLGRQIMVYDGSQARQRETRIQEWRFTQRRLSPRTDRLLSFHASRTVQ